MPLCLHKNDNYQNNPSFEVDKLANDRMSACLLQTYDLQ